jgi:hypothetical protein
MVSVAFLQLWIPLALCQWILFLGNGDWTIVTGLVSLPLAQSYKEEHDNNTREKKEQQQQQQQQQS